MSAQQAGSLDINFGNGGSAVIDFTGQTNKATSLALQPDGKVVVAGNSFNGTNYDFYVVRYNANGTLDNTFNGFGVASADFYGLADMCNAVAIQADGKILLAGSTVPSATIAGSYIAIARLNGDGTPDTTFGADGTGKAKYLTLDGSAYAIAVQSDGKILIGGVLSGIPTIARLLPNGTLDNSFSGNGYDSQDIGTVASIRKMVVQPNGKILACGGRSETVSPSGAIFRYNNNGTLDTAFSADGKIIDANANNNDMALLSDGRIIVAGTNSDFKMRLRRLLPDGSNDTTFGTSGFVTQSAYANLSQVLGLAVQEDGKYVVAGYSHSGGSEATLLYRFSFDGSTDGSFGTSTQVNGATLYSFGTDSSRANAIAIQPDGKILTAGYQFSPGNSADWVTARWNPECETPVSTPTGAAVQQFCGTTPFSAIVTSGTNVQWYGVPEGGTMISPTANLVNGTYYGEAVSGICTSPTRIAVTVAVTHIATGLSSASGVLTCIEADPGTTYQWQDCSTGTIIPGQTGQSFTPAQTGSYAAIVSQNGCSIATDCRTVAVLASKTFEKDSVTLWPNPVDGDQLEIRGLPDNALFRIVNMLGQEILRGKIARSPIVVSALRTGSYVIEIVTDKTRTAKRFVKK